MGPLSTAASDKALIAVSDGTELLLSDLEPAKARECKEQLSSVEFSVGIDRPVGLQ